jgi:hypothetical protein
MRMWERGRENLVQSNRRSGSKGEEEGISRKLPRDSLSIPFRSESVLGSISRLGRKQSCCYGNGEGAHIHTGIRVARILQKTTSVQRKVLKWFYLIKQVMCIQERKYRKQDTRKVTYIQNLAENFGFSYLHYFKQNA